MCYVALILTYGGLSHPEFVSSFKAGLSCRIFYGQGYGFASTKGLCVIIGMGQTLCKVQNWEWVVCSQTPKLNKVRPKVSYRRHFFPTQRVEEDKLSVGLCEVEWIFPLELLFKCSRYVEVPVPPILILNSLMFKHKPFTVTPVLHPQLLASGLLNCFLLWLCFIFVFGI